MLVAVLLFSLTLHPSVAQGFFAIYGTVRDENGRSLSSVRVSITDENYQPLRTVISDGSGHFQLRGLRAGSYYLRVEATGQPYEEYSQHIELYSMTRRNSTTEDPTLVDVVLTRKKPRTDRGNVSGVVFAQNVPPEAKREYDRAAAYLRNQDFRATFDSLNKAIGIFPDYFDALELLGTQYVKLRQFEAALPILTRALAINNKSGSAMYALGVAHLNLNRLDESINVLESASANDGNNPNVYMMLGLAYGQRRSWDQAEGAFKKAYLLGKANAADAHLYLAGIYDKRGRYSEARRELELYLKEAKGLKDRSQIREMIDQLKAKDNAKH